MLALGRGLMAEARLLMIDEPSLGLAPVIVNEVYRHIEGIVASGATLLLVEENFSHVQRFDAQILLLESGRIVRRGSVGDLLADEMVMATYLGT
jgi:branched-chain amino acid transport system ATP-binding protein